jgi:hypothetical protein
MSRDRRPVTTATAGAVVDLPRVRRALARLDEIAREHPEAFDPDRLPATPEALAKAMRRRPGRPPSADPTVTVTMRLPGSLLAAVDAALEELRRRRPRATRQDVIREALAAYVACKRRRR